MMETFLAASKCSPKNKAQTTLWYCRGLFQAAQDSAKCANRHWYFMRVWVAAAHQLCNKENYSLERIETAGLRLNFFRTLLHCSWNSYDRLGFECIFRDIGFDWWIWRIWWKHFPLKYLHHRWSCTVSLWFDHLLLNNLKTFHDIDQRFALS